MTSPWQRQAKREPPRWRPRRRARGGGGVGSNLLPLPARAGDSSSSPPKIAHLACRRSRHRRPTTRAARVATTRFLRYRRLLLASLNLSAPRRLCLCRRLAADSVCLGSPHLPLPTNSPPPLLAVPCRDSTSRRRSAYTLRHLHRRRPCQNSSRRCRSPRPSCPRALLEATCPRAPPPTILRRSVPLREAV